jgi:esterase/lipase
VWRDHCQERAPLHLVRPVVRVKVIAQVNSADKELIWFERSTHCLILDVEWEAAADKTLAFIQRVTGRAPAG